MPTQERRESMKFSKRLSFILAGLILAGSLTGCGGKNAEEEKVRLKVGHWPMDTEFYPLYEDYEAEFEKMYPDIDIIGGDIQNYEPETFSKLLQEGKIPAFIETYFTEIQYLISTGQVADITDALKANGLYDTINPDMLSMCTDVNGRVFGLPKDAYVIGLVINKDLFQKAGLVNEDGSPKAPKTYQELAEYAKIIKEKTGAAGFALPTIGNDGGWLFMNIAWSFGVEFEEKQSDGSYKAVFDTPQFKNAIRYIRDLRWKYDVLPEETVLDKDDQEKMIGTGKVAMSLMAPDRLSFLTRRYKMDKDHIYFARVPAGEAGRYAQMGGAIAIFNVNNTPEENDAAIKWYMYRGHTSEVTEETENIIRKNLQNTINTNGIVYPQTFFDVWIEPERSKIRDEIAAEYANVDMADYADYASFEDVIIRPEETVRCQQLYSVLDEVIRAVIEDENADIDALTKKAVEDFQTQYLDKVK